MRKKILSLLITIGIVGLLTSSTYAQTEIEQIIDVINQHKVIYDTNSQVINVKKVGGAVVIDLSQNILPDGKFDYSPFEKLEYALNNQLKLLKKYILTFKVEGKPLDHWGMPIPNFNKLRSSNKNFPFQKRTSGPLTGKKIALNAGHGYFYDGKNWIWQRSEYWNIREDLITAEIQMYVTQYLQNLGATIISLREPNKNAGNGSSGLPRWKEAARHYLRFLGAPSWVWSGRGSNYRKDILARPFGANYYNADLLFGLHTNGGGGTGTETYYDSTGAYNNVASSKKLANSIHSNVINKIQTNYNTAWKNRGIKQSKAAYGEIYYSTRPAVIMELSFHDTYSPDNLALQDVKFRKLVSQAIVQGICNYFNVPFNLTPSN